MGERGLKFCPPSRDHPIIDGIRAIIFNSFKSKSLIHFWWFLTSYYSYSWAIQRMVKLSNTQEYMNWLKSQFWREYLSKDDAGVMSLPMSSRSICKVIRVFESDKVKVGGRYLIFLRKQLILFLFIRPVVEIYWSEVGEILLITFI